MSVILETKQLCKFYGTGENQVKAVNHVNIQIQQGEFVAIVGKSGSGKSTLLHMLGGLDTPTKGSVTLAGKDLYRMKEDSGYFLREFLLPDARHHHGGNQCRSRVRSKVSGGDSGHAKEEVQAIEQRQQKQSLPQQRKNNSRHVNVLGHIGFPLG